MTEQTPAIDDVLAELERTSRLKQRRATYFLIALVGCGLLLLGLISYRIQSAYKELSGISQSVKTLRIEKTKLEAETLPNGRLMPKKPIHRCSDFLSDPKF